MTDQIPNGPGRSRPANESLAALRTRIDEARGFLWRRVMLLGMGLLLQVLTIYIWGFTVLDYLLGLPVWGRAIALAGLFFALLWVNIRYVISPFKRLYQYIAAARAVERSTPDLEESVSTAIEYGERDDLRALTSPEIIAALASDAVERADSVNFKDAARRGIPIGWKKVVTACAFMLGFIIVAATVPQLAGRAIGRLLLPWMDVAPPSLTVLDDVTPGDAEVIRGGDINVSAQLKGPGAGSAELLWRQAGIEDMRPVVFDMTVAEGKASGAIRRSETSFEYRIEAGDARTRWYSVEVYDPPAVKRLSLTITPPSYTGGRPIMLPDDDGTLKVLSGSVVEADVLTSVKSGRLEAVVNGTAIGGIVSDGYGKLSFNVDAPGRWELTVADNRGRVMDPPLSFPITIIEDKPPVVAIIEPRQKEASASREETVEIKMLARDDFALGEVGMVHNLGYEEKRTPVKRFEPGVTEDESTYRFRFPLKGLKGGEEVAYYAYALDADTKNGPKEARSDLRFLVVYDEERYATPESDKKKSPALKEVGRLIDGEKDSMKDTFEERSKLKPGEKPSPERRAELAAAQTAIQGRVERLLEKLETNPDDAFGAEERAHLESAAEAMEAATGGIERGDMGKALSHQGAALRHLSDVRRIVLSRAGSSPLDAAAQALENQDNARNNQARRNAEEAAVKLPEMLNKTRELERRLARLDERDPLTGGSSGEKPPEPEELGRRLRRPEQEMQELASTARSLARQMSGRNAPTTREQQASSQALDEAAQQYDEAAEATGRQDITGAKEALDEARRNVEDANANIGASGKELARRQLETAEGRARALAEEAHNEAAEQNTDARNARKMDELASKATSVERSLRELSGSTFLPRDAREAAELGARLSQQAAADDTPGELAEHMEQSADAARMAGERMDAADRAGRRELADKLSGLAAGQKELAGKTGDASHPETGLTAEQEALAGETSEAGNQATQLAGRERELAEAARHIGDALQSQNEAASALRRGDRTTAKGPAGDAARSLEDAARLAQDSLERSARQELLAALQSLKQAGAMAGKEAAQAQAEQRGAQGGEQQGEQQPTEAQGKQQGAQAGEQKGRQPAQAQGKPGGGQGGLPSEAEKLVQEALKHLENIPEGTLGDMPLDAMKRTAAAALNEQGRERPAPSKGTGSSGSRGKPGEQDSRPQGKASEPAQADARASDEGASPGKAAAEKNVELATRELAHSLSALDGRSIEPLAQLRRLASTIENAAGVPGMTAERGGREGLSAALAYLEDSLEASNLPEEAVKEAARAGQALKDVGRLPQGRVRVPGPNLLATGVQRAARSAIEAIDRAVSERDIPRDIPEKAAPGYEDVTREYFKTLSEK